MKKRFGNRINTAIELTSLLDVIFIVLMVVLLNSQVSGQNKVREAESRMEQAEAMMDEAADARAEAEADAAILKDQIEMLKDSEAQMAVITVYVDYTPSSPKNRHIRTTVNGTELERIDITPETQNEAYEMFGRQLDEVIAGYADGTDGTERRPVILSLDTTQILYRDEKAVDQVIGKLFDSYDNLFYKAGSAGDADE